MTPTIAIEQPSTTALPQLVNAVAAELQRRETEAVAKVGSVFSEVRRQMREEIGDQTLTRDEEFMLKQKYGMAAPQFSPSEHNLLRLFAQPRVHKGVHKGIQVVRG